MSCIQIATEAAWWYFSEWNPSTMNELPVIDTLRYSNRLKDAGFPAAQAEEMSRALNDEITSGLATRADIRGLKADIGGLKAEIGALDDKIDALDAKFDDKIDALDDKFDDKIDALDAKFDDKIDALDAKFDDKIDALDTKFDAKIDALDAKFDAKFDAVDAKFEAVDAKIDAVDGKLDTMGRYGLLVMALIVALGLYNAVAPRIGGDSPGPVAAETKAVALAHEVAELAAGR